MLIKLSFVVFLFIITLLSLPQISTAAEHIITLGVLAHRPKPETLSRFQPLVRYLAKELPDQKIRLEVFSYPELEVALAAKRLDFVLTNPGHYVQLRHLSGLSGALVTMIEQERGQAISSFGGVIFTCSDRTDINSLVHLKGKRIAIVGTGSLGGYQSQAFELIKARVNLPHDAGLVVTGMPHDSTVQAVLDGRADAGMVRTGVLEEMIQERKLDLSRLKILNLQKLPDFPYMSSTPLYPQWPFVALPHVPEELARRLTTALLGMPHIHNSNGLQGFTIPADYTPVEDLLRALRLPPFDKAPSFTIHDIWKRYPWQILATLLAGAIILLLSMRLIFANRKLKDSEIRYRTVANFTYDWEYWVAPDGSFRYMSPSCKQVCGYAAEDFFRDPLLLINVIHPEDRYSYNDYIHKITKSGEPEPINFRIITRDGRERWIMHVCRTVVDTDGKSLGQRATNRDITERILAEKALADSERFLKTIIDSEPECIKLLDINCNLSMMNRAGLEMIEADTFEQVKGHCVCPLITDPFKDDFIALTKRVFKGIPGKLEFEMVGLKGRHGWLETNAVPFRNEQGEIVYLLGITRDITERKQAEFAREEALAQVKKLEGIIPICMHCKKIRDDQNSWKQLERYISDHSEALFSHGICPQCYEEEMASIKSKKTSA